MKPKILTTLVGYTPRQFGADALAGLTVALVALPLSIAIAIASGAPPAAGLTTAIVAGFLISALGGSRVQIGGPTGAFIVVVYGIIHDHGYDGLLVATLLAGVILLVAGLLRAGRLIRHIPESVIEGFTIGIAVVIAVSQVKDLAGMTGGSLPADFLPKVSSLWAMRATSDLSAMMLGIGCIVAILVLRRFAPKVPWLVLVVAMASVIAGMAFPSVETVAEQYGALAKGLVHPSLPKFDLGTVAELLPSALTIAFLAGIESLLSAIVADRLIGAAHRSNAELIAQGVANVASPFSADCQPPAPSPGPRPMLTRAARTPVAGMIHALVILAALVFRHHFRSAGTARPGGTSRRHGLDDERAAPLAGAASSPQIRLALLLLTAVLTVFADLTVAIAVGTVIGLSLKFARGEIDPPDWHVPFRWGGDKRP